MDKNSIRTEDQKLERNQLIEYNRRKKAETNTVIFYFYIHYLFYCFKDSIS